MMNKIEPLDTREIIPGPNDRTTFDPAALQELASSIDEHGLIQPITVRWLDDADCYQIIAGERRFRACKDILGWEEIPALIADATDEEASAMMLAENISRENLDPIDEAQAYASRMTMFDLTTAEIAKQAGVSTIRVQFRLKLLSLRPEIQKLVRDDQISIGYAQTLADAGLDTNRQLIAIRALRDNPKPTTGWFRRVVNELLEQQAQGELFDLPLMCGSILNAPIVDAAPTIDPPLPTTHKPPKAGQTIREIIRNQVHFWDRAATEWDRIGKPFKRQECQAAAAALRSSLAMI